MDSTLEIQDNTNFDELNITYLPWNEQHIVSEELLGVASAPANDATGTRGMASCDVRCGYVCVGLGSGHFATPRHLLKTQRLLH